MLQPGRYEGMDLLVGEAWGRVERVQVLDVLSRAPCFLPQLALGARLRILSIVQLAGWDFIDETSGGMSVLLDEQDLRIVLVEVGEEGHDRAGTRMTHHFELAN